MHDRRSNSVRRALPWVAPFYAGVAIFLLLPLLLSALASLCDYSLIDPPLLVGLENYRRLLSDDLVLVSLRNTLVFALGSVVLSTVLSVSIALLLEQRSRGRELVRAIVFLPTLVPVAAASIAWTWIFNPRAGPLSAGLRAIGLPSPDWLGDPRWALPSLIAMSLWVVGTPTAICTAALRDIPPSLREAALIDGMSACARFRHVLLPMISHAVLFNVVTSLVWSLQVFAQPQIMTRGGPDHATLVYSLYVYRCAFEYGQMGYASALAWVQGVGTLTLTLAVLAGARRLVHHRGGD